jgi:hypothetical protein
MIGRRAYLSAFATVARTIRDADGWVPGFAMYQEHGPRFYAIVRRLERDCLVERCLEPGGPERGGRPRALYRWICERPE